MKEYIVTFFSHFGAIRFKKESGIRNIRLMPVPRALSSSCGTCAAFSADDFETEGIEDAEQVVCRTRDGGYESIWKRGDE